MHNFFSIKFGCSLYCHEDGTPIVVPCLFSHALATRQMSYLLTYIEGDKNRIKPAKLTEKELSETTIIQVMNELKNFLLWIENYSQGNSFISLAKHHNAHEDILNYYLNDFLVGDLQKSEGMANKAVMALRTYYNYLAYNGFTTIKNLHLTPKYRELSRGNTQTKTAIRYFSPLLMNTIYSNANSLRDECILRAGGECGLRAKENIGLLMDDFTIQKKTYKGISSLIDEMNNTESDSFEFYLQGIYTKGRTHHGGLSRMIHISRETLIYFERYIHRERPSCNIDNLFLTEPSSGYLKAISSAVVRDAFGSARSSILNKQIEGLFSDNMDVLEDEHSYHVLRHSFGTNKFYEAVVENNLKLDSVTSDSLPYLIVARLLGHQTNDRRGASETTRTYIHSCQIKLAIESHV
ncbi:site-specific integrase [Colwellia sp. BRX10-6]|uniref:site-specific integrase n=1 Tax=unclassified Colwellia TaxID=196834 RepID=UPI0015F4D873|nr:MULTISPECIES: site-specific integrase [unclassified Colwellia]MBA6383810.1 site-specific integrase [Colwellia sp. BRX10-9]MBA6395277.1 site-specific integrase [Colwellia sp. BRX10-6]